MTLSYARTYYRGSPGYTPKFDTGPFGWGCNCCGPKWGKPRAAKPFVRRVVRRKVRCAMAQLRFALDFGNA